jgi:hypothetical protein
MRRLYVVPKSVYLEHRQLFSTHQTSHWLGLVPSSESAAMTAWKAAGEHVVVSTEFLSEGPQETWESHPLVTVLPHPIWHGKEPITVARSLPENVSNVRCGQTTTQNASLPMGLGGVGAHGEASGQGNTPEGEEKVVIDGIDHLVGAGFGVMAADTVIQVHQKLAAVHPAFRLRPLR